MYEGRGAFELKEDKKAAAKQVKVNQKNLPRQNQYYSQNFFLGKTSEHDSWWYRNYSHASTGESSCEY